MSGFAIRFVSGKWFGPVVLALILVLWELSLCAPGIVAGDAPELTTAAFHLGSAHPPGYPLYVLLGKFFLLFPVGSAAFRLTFFSIWILLMAFLLAVLVLGKNGPDTPPLPLPVILPAAALLFMSPQLLHQSLSPEVFALHSLFTMLFLYFVLNASQSNWPFICFAMGLGLSNQHLTLLILPALLWAYRKVWMDRTEAARGIAFLGLGLSLYLLLPLRAHLHPPVNWGEPDSWGRFFTHVTRGQYGGDIPKGRFLDAFWDLWFYLKLWAMNGWAFVGMITLLGWWARRKSAPGAYWIGLGSTLLLPPLLLRTPDTTEFHSIILPFLTPFILWCLPGLAWGLDWIFNRTQVNARAWTVGWTAALLVLGLVTGGDQDQSRNLCVSDMSHNILLQLPQKAALFAEGDEVTYPLAYQNLVSGKRKDLFLFDRTGGLLQHLSMGNDGMPQFMLEQFWAKKNHPSAVFYSENAEAIHLPLKMSGFLFQADSSNETPNPRGIWDLAITPRIPEKADYLTRETASRFYIFRLNQEQDPSFQQSDLHQVKTLAFDNARLLLNVGLWEKGNRLLDPSVLTFTQAIQCDPGFAMAWYQLGDAHLAQGREAEALHDQREAVRLDPDNFQYHHHLAYLLFKTHQVEEAQVQWEETIRLNPSFPEPYRNLAFTSLQANPLFALQMFHQYLTLVPNPPDKAVILKNLNDLEKLSSNTHS